MEKKSLFKRVTALLCCIMMLVTTVPVYALENGLPGATLVVPSNTTLYTDYGASEISSNKNAIGSNYIATLDNGVVTFAGNDYDEDNDEDIPVTLSRKTIVFYAKTKDGERPQVSCDMPNDDKPITVEEVGPTTAVGKKGAQWKITVTFGVIRRGLDAEITMDFAKPQVTVTFTPADANCIFEVKKSDNLWSEVSGAYSVDQGSTVYFRVGQEIPDESKQYVVYVGGVKQTADENGVYEIKNVQTSTRVSVTSTPTTYTVTWPASGTGYTCNRSGSSTVNCNGSITFTVTAADGYAAPTVSIGNGRAELITNAGGSYTLENITGDIVVSVTAGTAHTYSVHLSSGTGYTAKFVTVGENDLSVEVDDNPMTFNHGADAKFKVTADNGYEIDAVKVGTKRLAPAGGVYSVKVTDDIDVEVTAKKRNYNITYELYDYSIDGEGKEVFGVVETTDAFSVVIAPSAGEFESICSVTVVPKNGYAAPTVKVGGTTLVSVNGTYSFQVKGDTVVVIEAPKKTTYTVYLPAGASFANGYTSKVVHGGDVKFTVTTEDKYDIDTVTANDIPLTAEDGVYTVSNVTADVVVKVNTRAANCRVEYKYYNNENEKIDNPAGFTVNPGLSTADFGSSYTFTVAPVEGYKAPVVKVNGGTVSPDGNNQYTVTISNRKTEIEITAGKQITYNVTLVEATGSSLAVDNASPIHGGTVNVTITVEEQYSADNLAVSINGLPVPATKKSDGIYTVTITNITEDKTVSVSALQKITYEVTLPANPVGYTLQAISSTTVFAGDAFVFTLTRLDGFTGEAVVKANGTVVDKDDSGYYRVTINSNTTITVEGIEAVTYKATVNIVDSDAATVEVVGAEAIPYGGSYKFKVNVNSGYRIDYVYADGVVEPDRADIYTIDNVTADITINVYTQKNVLTVNYVSSEEGHKDSFTKKFDITNIDKVLDEKLKGCTVHSFGAWLNGGSEASEGALKSLISTADAEVTLTARFDLTAEALEYLLTLDQTTRTVAAKGETNQVTYRTVAHVPASLKDGEGVIDACVERLTTVTAIGTLLSNDGTLLVEGKAVDLKEALLKRAIHSEKEIRAEALDGYDGNVRNYYNTVDLKLSDIDGRYTELGITTKNPDSRYAAGWMEYSIGGKKFIVLAKQCEWKTADTDETEE